MRVNFVLTTVEAAPKPKSNQPARRRLNQATHARPADHSIQVNTVCQQHRSETERLHPELDLIPENVWIKRRPTCWKSREGHSSRRLSLGEWESQLVQAAQGPIRRVDHTRFQGVEGIGGVL